MTFSIVYETIKRLSQTHLAVSAYGNAESIIVGGGSTNILQIEKGETEDPWMLIENFLHSNDNKYIMGYMGYGLHQEYEKKGNVPICVLFVADEIVRLDGFRTFKKQDIVPKPTFIGDLIDIRQEKTLERRILNIIEWCQYEPEKRRITLSHKVPLPFILDLIKVFSFPNPIEVIKNYKFIKSLYFKFSNIIEYAGISPEMLIEMIDKDMKTYKLSGTIPLFYKTGETYSKTIKEHQLTISSIINSLSELGELNIKGPYLLKLYRIMHLYSIINIKLNSNHILEVLKKSLMKGAEPPGEGIKILSNLEDFERGPYYGNHIVIYPNRKVRASQILRCIFKAGEEVYSIAGASITAFSNPANEMIEIQSKFREIFFY